MGRKFGLIIQFTIHNGLADVRLVHKSYVPNTHSYLFHAVIGVNVHGTVAMSLTQNYESRLCMHLPPTVGNMLRITTSRQPLKLPLLS